jgi:carboxypeptidase C (cathepsin A)
LEEGKNYSKGDLLTENPHSWHNFSNLLFIESPAGVGFSINSDSSYEYNDVNTMNDNFDALRYFFTRFSEYSKNRFWIAG